MRLLRKDSSDSLVLFEFTDSSLPAYAILSHTWNHGQEVTYDDLIAGTGERKAGYAKLRFCAERAAHDGLDFFWVDTCCINKQDLSETTTAINSMFRWYQRATRCYVYLSDVHVPPEVVDINTFRITWEHAFRRSRWFTRGWTLQELLAPSSVEFFSKGGQRLGTKITLERELHEITQIPVGALRSFDLRDFSIDDRISWSAKRVTTVPEDKSYCLLGICGIFLPLIYGEGEVHAIQRLRKETGTQITRPQNANGSRLENDKNYADCLRSLGFSNLDARQNDIVFAHAGTCDWLFETTAFCKWRNQIDLADHNGVLWIKGKPGTGKSTLMKHTLNFCEKELGNHLVVAYFFNMRGERLEKTALGMLRSMIYQLVKKSEAIYERFLLRFCEKRIMNETGIVEWRLPELRDFLVSEILQGQSKRILLFVDALDECHESDVRSIVTLLEMLSIKATQVQTTLRICLSSRHYPSINMIKKLELTVEHSREHCDGIAKYVEDELEIKDTTIEAEIYRKADGVFLWAALVVAMLNDTYRRGRIEEVHTTLNHLPGDLEHMFDTMLARDDSHKAETMFMLQLVLLSPEPLQPEELFFAVLFKATPKFMGPWDRSKINSEVIRRRITDSSKGLIEIRPGDQSQVQFIHRSVNDFLLRNQRLQRLDSALGPYPVQASCRLLWSHCLEYMNLVGITIPIRALESEGMDVYPFLRYAACFVFDFAETSLSQYQVFQAQDASLWSLPDLHDSIRASDQGYRVISDWIRAIDNSWLELWARIAGWYSLAKHDFQVERCAGLLYTLSINGYHRLASLLLTEKGVNVNAEGGHFGNALQAASYWGWEAMVQLLLDNGADVNASSGYYGSALQAASSNGSMVVVQLLLDNGADVNASSGYYGSALQAASDCKWEALAQLLVKHGAR